MSIFDKTPGNRPVVDAAAVPGLQSTAAEQAPTISAAKPTSLSASIEMSPGERPTPVCSPVIIWPDALEGQAEKSLSDLPPVRPAPVLVRPAEQALAEIDAALRRNSARVTVNGLFDLDDHDWHDR